MKKILFIILIGCSSCKAQMLFKTVNGVKIPFTAADYVQYRVDSTNNVKRIVSDSATAIQSRQIKSSIVTTAQTAVGVRYDLLTAAQVRALVAILFFKEGAIDSALRIKPLNQWVK